MVCRSKGVTVSQPFVMPSLAQMPGSVGGGASACWQPPILHAVANYDMLALDAILREAPETIECRDKEVPILPRTSHH